MLERLSIAFGGCSSSAISDDDADLILLVEILDIVKIRDPVFGHLDFGVSARIIERRKGKYVKPVIGLHVPRQVPLEDYEPEKYGFKKGQRTVIKGKVDSKGRITIHDPRIKFSRVVHDEQQRAERN